MRILIVTNDGTVFKEERCEAENMFGGRVAEVIDLKRMLSKDHVVSINIISGEYGLVDGNDIISSYRKITDSKKEYEELQDRTHFSEKLQRISKDFDVTLIFVPKEMMRLLICSKGSFKSVMAATSPEFKDIFERRGWTFYERKGARIGKDNKKRITSFFSCS